MGIPCQFSIIVEKADQPEPNSDEQSNPNIGIAQIRPQQGRDAEREQDQETAHRRRSLFAQQVPIGTIRSNRLSIALLAAQPEDQARSENKTDQESSNDCPS
jgi:hypothetical protein